jgi:dienelactone hydrolase
LDFRGFGESKNAQYSNRATSRDKMSADVDAALKFLSSQSLVNGTLLGVVGGSCGVNQAVHAAQRHPEIRTVVLLSGDTDVDGEAFIPEIGEDADPWCRQRGRRKRSGRD